MPHWPDPADLLARLVAAPSISGAEQPALDVLTDAFTAAGIPTVRYGRNLVATWGTGSGPSVWLNSHVDTVKVPEGYTFDPFSGKRLDDRVLGLGSNDAKGSIVAMADAFVSFVAANRENFGGTLSFVAVCDEETGGDGTEFLRRVLPKPDAAVLGEPNALVVSNACKGLVRAFIDVRGLSAHASRPWQGNNAIRLAAPVLERLCADRAFPLDPRLGVTTLEPTMIQGGTSANAIAGEVRITLDGRTTPTFDNRALVAWLQAALADLPGVAITVKSARINATHTADDGRLVQSALGAVHQAAPAPFPSVCDFVWMGDCDALVMGPGQLERSHKPDEFLLVDELYAGADAYRRTLASYFGVNL